MKHWSNWVSIGAFLVIMFASALEFELHGYSRVSAAPFAVLALLAGGAIVSQSPPVLRMGILLALFVIECAMLAFQAQRVALLRVSAPEILLVTGLLAATVWYEVRIRPRIARRMREKIGARGSEASGRNS